MNKAHWKIRERDAKSHIKSGPPDSSWSPYQVITEGERKPFHDKKKLKKLITTKSRSAEGTEEKNNCTQRLWARVKDAVTVVKQRRAKSIPNTARSTKQHPPHSFTTYYLSQHLFICFSAVPFTLRLGPLSAKCYQLSWHICLVLVVGSRWSPKWMGIVGMIMAMARTPMAQAHGNSKALPGPGSGSGTAIHWSTC